MAAVMNSLAAVTLSRTVFLWARLAVRLKRSRARPRTFQNPSARSELPCKAVRRGSSTTGEARCLEIAGRTPGLFSCSAGHGAKDFFGATRTRLRAFRSVRRMFQRMYGDDRSTSLPVWLGNEARASLPIRFPTRSRLWSRATSGPQPTLRLRAQEEYRQTTCDAWTLGLTACVHWIRVPPTTIVPLSAFERQSVVVLRCSL